MKNALALFALLVMFALMFPGDDSSVRNSSSDISSRQSELTD